MAVGKNRFFFFESKLVIGRKKVGLKFISIFYNLVESRFAVGKQSTVNF